MTEKLTTRQARQGPPGRPVLAVLVASLGLAAVYLVATLLWSGTSQQRDGADLAASRPQIVGALSDRPERAETPSTGPTDSRPGGSRP